MFSFLFFIFLFKSSDLIIGIWDLMFIIIRVRIRIMIGIRIIIIRIRLFSKFLLKHFGGVVKSFARLNLNSDPGRITHQCKLFACLGHLRRTTHQSVGFFVFAQDALDGNWASVSFFALPQDPLDKHSINGVFFARPLMPSDPKQARSTHRCEAWPRDPEHTRKTHQWARKTHPLLFISAARSPFGESAENPNGHISAQDPGPEQFYSWILGKPGTPIGEKFDPGISGKPEAPVDTLSSPIDSVFDPIGKHKQHTHTAFGPVILARRARVTDAQICSWIPARREHRLVHRPTRNPKDARTTHWFFARLRDQRSWASWRHPLVLSSVTETQPSSLPGKRKLATPPSSTLPLPPRSLPPPRTPAPPSLPLLLPPRRPRITL